MFFQKALKYKILEFCIDKFFDNVYKNFSKAIPLDGTPAPCTVHVYKIPDDIDNDIFSPHIVVKIVTTEYEYENAMSLEDCQDIFVQIGENDGINEIILMLTDSLPYDMDE